MRVVDHENFRAVAESFDILSRGFTRARQEADTHTGVHLGEGFKPIFQQSGFSNPARSGE